MYVSGIPYDIRLLSSYIQMKLQDHILFQFLHLKNHSHYRYSARKNYYNSENSWITFLFENIIQIA
jgi:hypothetical protein